MTNANNSASFFFLILEYSINLL